MTGKKDQQNEDMGDFAFDFDADAAAEFGGTASNGPTDGFGSEFEHMPDPSKGFAPISGDEVDPSSEFKDVFGEASDEESGSEDNFFNPEDDRGFDEDEIFEEAEHAAPVESPAKPGVLSGLTSGLPDNVKKISIAAAAAVALGVGGYAAWSMMVSPAPVAPPVAGPGMPQTMYADVPPSEMVPDMLDTDTSRLALAPPDPVADAEALVEDSLAAQADMAVAEDGTVIQTALTDVPAVDSAAPQATVTAPVVAAPVKVAPVAPVAPTPEVAAKAPLDESIAQILAELRGVSDRIGRLEGDFVSKNEIVSRLEKIEQRVARLEGGSVRAPAPPRAAPADDVITPQAGSRVAAPVPRTRPAYGAKLSPPLKPTIIDGYSLKGVARGIAWIETPNGIEEASVGKAIPGAGTIKAISRVSGEWVLVTDRGVIVR